VTFCERPLGFDCRGERLIGVASLPESPASVGVVIVVGGPQYRAGSHRQFVLLARRLAEAGIAVLRFDCRGMGDSTGEPAGFEDTAPDIDAAVAALAAASPTIGRVVLWGLCDAAAGSLLYCDATHDPRIAGMVLLNPWVRSEETLARTHVRHYYGARVLEAAFWRKLLAGKVDLRASVRSLVAAVAAMARGARSANPTTPSYQDRMAAGLARFDGPVLILLSGRDLTAKEFSDYVGTHPRWSAALQGARVERQSIAEADHTFSTAGWRREAEDRMLDWLRRHGLLPVA